jgi:hypothetical protein
VDGKGIAQRRGTGESVPASEWRTRVSALHNYVINVASYKNGVGYGKWTHIDGWSESVIEYVRELEIAQED